ncbi:hypothetical protein BH23BAC4_BH23BAC4_03320 [soil metagenome]
MRFTRLFLLLALSVAVTACGNVSTVVSVDRDGSGTITDTVLFSTTALDMMRSFTPDTVDVDPAMMSAEDAAQRAESLGAGVRLVSVEAIVGDGSEGYRAVFAFSDIRTLEIGLTSAFGAEASQGVPQEEPMTFDFEPASGMLSVHVPRSEPAEETERRDPEEVRAELARMAPMIQAFGEIGVAVSLEFPGGIAETDAQFVSGTRVTLAELSLTQLLTNADRLAELQLQTVDNLIGYQDELPGVRFEPLERVTIRLAD